ncbi:hydroxymethylbilane synthase [Clostridium sp. ZS2-4]|uniref:hydroxymethylbilane synthase n=1 Tax=Clostridium sp. ZS2-4 TaxID=2987703 RepID=UPI003FA39BBD
MLNLKIATRKSNLAQGQTELVMNIIKEKFDIESEKLLIETEGDKKLDVTLDKIGGKGLFVKDIEIALAEGRADAAVHSMKDVPYEINDIFEIAAILSREDVRDTFVSSEGMSFFELPKGAKVGTSSNRRAAQIKLIRPDIETVPIRGNVETRIAKMKTERLDGIVLAAAGLKRLKLEHVITNYFDPAEFLPAVGQGALGIEIVSNSINGEIFRKLDDLDVRICVEAERSFMKKMNGGCHTAIGAYSFVEGETMYMIGTYQLGDRLVKKEVHGNKSDYIRLGEELGAKIIKG